MTDLFPLSPLLPQTQERKTMAQRAWEIGKGSRTRAREEEEKEGENSSSLSSVPYTEKRNIPPALLPPCPCGKSGRSGKSPRNLWFERFTLLAPPVDMLELFPQWPHAGFVRLGSGEVLLVADVSAALTKQDILVLWQQCACIGVTE